MPMTSRQGRGSCGDGRISGAEECDPQDVDSQFLCAENCRVRRDQRSASGRGFSCFIDSTHRVVCVGQQINPVFTPGRRDAVPYQIVGPTLIQTLDQAIVAVAAGGRHICALTLAGTVLCWGDQTKAQTGRCEQANRMLGTPETVKRVEGIELTRVSGISAYGDTTCAWTHEGELYCWGESTFGQTGSREPIVTCATRVGDEGFKARKAAVGDNFTCALTPNNKVRCFGLNDALQLGVSTNNTCRDGQFSYPCSREPLGAVEIQANTPLIATQLSAGSGACAIAENAELFCWGPHPHYNGGIPITQDAHLSNDDGHGAAKVMGLVGATKVGMVLLQ